MRLSPSKIACLMRCGREYAFNYILKVPQTRGKALLLGSAFHGAIEGKPADLAPLQAIDSEYPWHACLTRMLAGYQAAIVNEPKEIVREIVHETEEIKIIADGIWMDKDGHWFLAENKSASVLDEKKRILMPNEIQMIAYTAHAEEIGESSWQDPKMFAGVKYVTTLKPMERRKKTEDIDEFGKRLTSSTVVWTFPASLFSKSKQQWAVLTEFAGRRISEIECAYHKANAVDVLPANTAACVRWGNPCPYFSHCHGEEPTNV